MNLELVRFAYLPNVTLGRLYVAGRTFCTLEEPWTPDPDGPGGQRREPGKNESAVPDGLYQLVPHSGNKWKDVWALVNPALGVYRTASDMKPGQLYGRVAILIGHPGNTVLQIEGCILTGLTHSVIDGLDAVTATIPTLNQLRQILGTTETHQLRIRPTAGTLEIAA